MKKLFPKIIAIAMVLIMAVQVSGAALAATVSWPSGNYTYVAEVIKKGVPGSLPVNVTSSETYHTMGTANYIYAGIRSVTSPGDVEFPSAYASRLRQAATAEGVNYTLTSNVNFTQNKRIPPNYATGTYCLVSTVLGVSGEYHVYKIGGGASSTIKSGTFACAPVGYSGVITGLYLMSLGEQPIN
ncbi:MAG: hypothetical protein IKZ82_11745 [Clostridia bacterium]|nr:hypothetical protein [Clostridia bacterium]